MSRPAHDDPSVGRLRLDGPSPAVEPGVHLVVGYDVHPASHLALEFAGDLAGRLHAQLHVVHAVDLSDYPIDPDQPDWEIHARDVLAGERQAVAAALAGHAWGWTYHAWRGDPVKLLRTVADEHDALMFIVGTRGYGPLATLQRLLDGSVSHGLIGHQRRPVVVVPAQHD
jgi:nucleotide-binding universal stress UspA family protein